MQLSELSRNLSSSIGAGGPVITHRMIQYNTCLKSLHGTASSMYMIAARLVGAAAPAAGAGGCRRG
jgi:hypothetical protein